MLKKELGLWAVFSIAAGAMISSGLFVLPGIAFARTGPALILAYLLAGILNLPTMFSQAELATAMPVSGGSYFVVERSLGAFAGTIAGLVNWLSIALKAAFAVFGIGALAEFFFPQIGESGIKATAIAACLLFSALNVVSVKGTGRLQGLMVIGLFAILGVFIVGGIPKVTPERYTPFMTSGFRSFFAVTGMVFVSYGGLTKVVDVAEEVQDPPRNLVWGMILAFAAVNVAYVLTVFVTVGVTDGAQLRGSMAPIALGADATMGAVGTVIIAVAAFLAYATTANAGILSASRSPMAMSRDGLLPELFSRTSSRFGTPSISIVITSSLMIFVISFLSVENLVKTASTMLLISFVLVNIAVVILRRSRIQGYRPTFRAPLLPWLPLGAVVLYGFLIAEMGRVPLITTAAFLGVAALWYLTYVHWRIDRQSAIIYLVKTILSRHIKRTGLEDELLRISLERDSVKQDRFDEIVKSCPVLDIKEPISAQELFNQLADVLAPKLGKEQQDIVKLFRQREMESSTVVQPGLAIPHIVIEGNQVFEIALVRCRAGAVFSELTQPVKTAFVLIGSEDERNFHLKALVAIAHIVQEVDFEKRWIQARNVEQLRDIVILSRRKRMERS